MLITPPPLDDGNAAWRDGRRSNARHGQYAAAAAGVAREAGVALVDLYSLLQRQDGNWRSTMLADDGLHLSARGNKALADAVLKAIDERYPSLKPYSLPLHFPEWRAVDPKNPAATFDRAYGYKVNVAG